MRYVRACVRGVLSVCVKPCCHRSNPIKIPGLAPRVHLRVMRHRLSKSQSCAMCNVLFSAVNPCALHVSNMDSMPRPANVCCVNAIVLLLYSRHTMPLSYVSDVDIDDPLKCCI